MNLTHRAIFYARLGLSSCCDAVCRGSSRPDKIEAILAEKETNFGKIKSLAITGLRGQQLGEAVSQIFSDSASADLNHFGRFIASAVCVECAKKQVATSGQSHICDGVDFDQDESAHQAVGLCTEPITQAYGVAQKLADDWYQLDGYHVAKDVLFEFHGVRIERDVSGYSSKVPHNFGDHPTLVAANAITSQEFHQENQYRIELQICVDRILAQHFAQIVLILHHEFFCHVNQNHQAADSWPDRNDLFTEGFVNAAAFKALALSGRLLSSEELSLLYCQDAAEFETRIAAFHEARETSSDGALLRYGTTTFQVLEQLLSQVDPHGARHLAIQIAIAINASELSADQRLQLVIALRESAVLTSSDVHGVGEESGSVERMDALLEALCQFLEHNDIYGLSENLTSLASLSS